MGSKRVFFWQFETSAYDVAASGWTTMKGVAQAEIDNRSAAAKVLGLTANSSIIEYALTEIPTADKV